MIRIFQFLQFLIIIFTAILISDHRNKNVTQRLISPYLLFSIYSCYAIPVLISAVVILRINELYWSDWFGLFLTLIGLTCIYLAKKNLGKDHNWAGYGSFPNSFRSSGIYSYIRHQMYFGILLCIYGMLIIVLRHAEFILAVIYFVCGIFVTCVILFSAKKESEHLAKIFGEEYVKYEKQVNFIIPIKKIRFKLWR